MNTADNNKDMITTAERREMSINTWERAFLVTLKTTRLFKRRLKELQTWDNCNGNDYEREVKIEALQRLIG